VDFFKLRAQHHRRHAKRDKGKHKPPLADLQWVQGVAKLIAAKGFGDQRRQRDKRTRAGDKSSGQGRILWARLEHKASYLPKGAMMQGVKAKPRASRLMLAKRISLRYPCPMSKTHIISLIRRRRISA
jgi:hypothetical protein